MVLIITAQERDQGAAVSDDVAWHGSGREDIFFVAGKICGPPVMVNRPNQVANQFLHAGRRTSIFCPLGLIQTLAHNVGLRYPADPGLLLNPARQVLRQTNGQRLHEPTVRQAWLPCNTKENVPKKTALVSRRAPFF
jgi:hypothetical protein